MLGTVAEQSSDLLNNVVQQLNVRFSFLSSSLPYHPRLQVGNSNSRMIAMLSHVESEKFVSKIKFHLSMLVSYYSKIARSFSYSSNKSEELNI